MHGKLIKIKNEKVPHGRESRITAYGVINLCADGSARSLIRKDSTEREDRVHVS